MQEQENVYVETESAEQGTKGVAAKDVAVGEVGSAALGKFKDVNALFEAYRSLQAEFTRRSQRLKRLEREAEKRGLADVEAEETAETATAEVVEHQSDTIARPDLVMGESVETGAAEEQGSPEQNECFSGGNCAVNADMGGSFLETDETQGALIGERTDDGVAQNTETASQQGVWRGARVFSQGASGQESAAISHQNANDPDALYERASANESVRLRIVGDYLSSIQKGGAPLMRGGTQAIPSGKTQAQTIAEAGQRTLIWLREKGIQK